MEEVCTKEEAREVFENDPETVSVPTASSQPHEGEFSPAALKHNITLKLSNGCYWVFPLQHQPVKAVIPVPLTSIHNIHTDS